MAADRLYLDVNAGAPLRPVARQAIERALDLAGNPSSVHAEGRAARRLIEEAREKIASLMGVAPPDVVFTSGASEAANTALTPKGLRRGGELGRLLLGATEHACLLKGHRFAPDRVEFIGVDGEGRIDVGSLAARISELGEVRGPLMLAIQAANNETGVLQPISEIAESLMPLGAILVVDAAQSVGKIPHPGVKADVALLSSHKLGGPQGAGAMVFGSGRFRPNPLIAGGGQERGQRAGTENVAAISGFAAAAVEAFGQTEAFAARTLKLRDGFEEFLRQNYPGVVFFGAKAARLSNTSCFAIPRISAETALMALDLGGLAVSSGSACSSGKVAPSHVLAAMGISPELARSALRVSFGWDFPPEDVNRVEKVWKEVLAKILDNGHMRAA